MEQESFDVGDIGERDRNPPTEQYLNLTCVLKELLDLGFITLPTMSTHFSQAIHSALAGDVFPITQAIKKLLPYADKIIDLETLHDYTHKWKKHVFDNVFVTYRVVMFYYTICHEREREIRHATSQHKKQKHTNKDSSKSSKSSPKAVINKADNRKRTKP